MSPSWGNLDIFWTLTTFATRVKGHFQSGDVLEVRGIFECMEKARAEYRNKHRGFRNRKQGGHDHRLRPWRPVMMRLGAFQFGIDTASPCALIRGTRV